MKLNQLLYFLICIALALSVQAQQKLICTINSDQSVTIKVDSTIHQDYGLSYPLTYQFSVPSTVSSLRAFKRYSVEDPWSEVPERAAGSSFNGVEVFRYDDLADMAYVSVTLADDSDSLFLKIEDASNTIVSVDYLGIAVYYDNRTAVVTCSADDWADWFDGHFPYAVSVFRDYNLWLSVGIISEGCNATTWQHIQEQLDLGLVEAASHSRNHPHSPYSDTDYEVSGSKFDIIENLDLPDTFRKGDQEYVYTWIAPYGEYDDDIDASVASNQYLVSRMYTSGTYTFSEWVDDRSFYGSVGMSREVGPFWEGTTDLEDLNAGFDTAYGMNGVYHLMCHPHVLAQENIWGYDYIWSHLEYVSNREDIWYASVGQVYLYHLMQDESSFSPLEVYEDRPGIPNFKIQQNYPNPFNSMTTIRFALYESSQPSFEIFNLEGELAKVLSSGALSAGYHRILWDGMDQKGQTVETGVYL
ncbi:MAG: hypothetical protein H8E18_12275, partial [FCB group bacterium]|nr:hypothetical protein [FCB group bacterium]